MEYFRDKVNAQEITSHSAILTDDITIDNSVVWKPISLADHCESTFDGKGHTITFANTKEGSTFGLFGSYNYSTISNLYLKGSITCNQSDLLGALINSGYRTTVKNVISTVSITNSGNASTGGLFGRLGGKNEQAMIKNCAVYADIQSAGRAGGLIGENWGGTQHCFVQNSAYMGDVSGSTAGVIMGWATMVFKAAVGVALRMFITVKRTDLTFAAAHTAAQSRLPVWKAKQLINFSPARWHICLTTA